MGVSGLDWIKETVEKRASAKTVTATIILLARVLNTLRELVEKVCIYGFARRHIKASQVTSGAALCARLVRASMMAVILLIVECAGYLAA